MVEQTEIAHLIEMAKKDHELAKELTAVFMWEYNAEKYFRIENMVEDYFPLLSKASYTVKFLITNINIHSRMEELADSKFKSQLAEALVESYTISLKDFLSDLAHAVENSEEF